MREISDSVTEVNQGSTEYKPTLAPESLQQGRTEGLGGKLTNIRLRLLDRIEINSLRHDITWKQKSTKNLKTTRRRHLDIDSDDGSLFGGSPDIVNPRDA